MFGRLFDALFGAFGIIRKTRKYNPKATWEKFVKSCLACKRPGEFVVSFILTASVNHNFISGGISGATDSPWTHALTCLWYYGENIKDGFEIVESQELVRADYLKKYCRNDVQLIAFSVSLNKNNFEKLKNNLYSQLGKPYDVAEFLSYLKGVFSLIPDPADLHVCSTLTTFGARGVYHRWFGFYRPLRLVSKNINPEHCTPADIYAGCYPQLPYRVSKYLC